MKINPTQFDMFDDEPSKEKTSHKRSKIYQEEESHRSTRILRNRPEWRYHSMKVDK